jgi:hypothetical protein
MHINIREYEHTYVNTYILTLSPPPPLSLSQSMDRRISRLTAEKEAHNFPPLDNNIIKPVKLDVATVVDGH